MKTFWQTIFRVFHKYLVWSVVLYLILMFPLSFLFRFVETPEKTKEPATVFCSMILFCYGLSRIWRFHPEFNKSYLTQLALSPWELGKALPRGRVHLFWADAVVVGFFMLLTWIFPVESVLVLPFIFLIGYNLGLFTSFCATGQIKYIVIYVVLAPLIVYPHLNGIISAIVVLLMTGIGLYGVHCYLKAFPWNTDWWTGNQVDMLKRQAVRRRVIQWPFSDLRTPSFFSGGLAFGLAMGTLAFWYTHTLDWLSYKSDNDHVTDTYYGLIIFAIVAFRFFCYILKFHPPISLFGRIRTGRLIIPGYDVVFVGLVVVLLPGIFLPSLLRMIGIPVYIAYEISVSMCVFLGLAVPPSFEKWVYTGQHRIAAIPIKPMPTVKKNQANELFGNLFKKQK